jgi:erythromycin esterase-like protein
MKLLKKSILIGLLLAFAQPVMARNIDRKVFEVYKQYISKNSTTIKTITDLKPMFEAIGERRFVLLGESTHGTHEYYSWRDVISRELISRKGFNFIAVEGDWQSIYRLNEYVKHRTPKEQTARSVMAQLTRWPMWMWANQEFADLLEWIRNHNISLPPERRVGVFGLDMQDPMDSMAAVLAWFRKHDRKNYVAVKAAYKTISDLPENFRGYVRGLAQGQPRRTKEVALPVQILRKLVMAKGVQKIDKYAWAAKQNALAVKRAEAQYHAMLTQSSANWNLRASYMKEAFLRIAERYGKNSKGIVWAHNTHVGDARATDMTRWDQVNIGQLLRESQGEAQVYILGFATHGGKVIAGANWGSPMQTMNIIPARPNSIEAIFRSCGLKQSLIIWDAAAALIRKDPSHKMNTMISHRAIGVIYRPPNEAYVQTIMPLRYNATFYIDHTSPLKPLAK